MNISVIFLPVNLFLTMIEVALSSISASSMDLLLVVVMMVPSNVLT